MTSRSPVPDRATSGRRTTAIAWTEKVWNATKGCDQVSPGCDHCYAMSMAKRLKAMGQAAYQLDGDPRTSGPGFLAHEWPPSLDLPMHWRDPTLVFVNSMSDLFHDNISDDYIARVFAVMAQTPRHTFQLLTKRHARMRSLLSSFAFVDKVHDHIVRDPDTVLHSLAWPLSNVWLGVSVENQQWADIRIPALLDTPAAVRWLSCEPLLSPVTLTHVRPARVGGPLYRDALRPVRDTNTGAELEPRIDWVVVGGESGRGHRPMDLYGLQSIADQCEAASVPLFVKQDSGPRSGQQGRISDELWSRKSYPRPDALDQFTAPTAPAGGQETLPI